MSIVSRATFAAVMAAALAGPVLAGNVSFTGSFVYDNDVQLFTFSLASDATVTFQTLGYGGGTNVNGQAVAKGGFIPVLQVYFASSGIAQGGIIQPGPDAGGCGSRNLDPDRLFFCMDAFANVPLTAGSYILSLTQSPNDPIGNNLSDGFFYVNAVPDPDFNLDPVSLKHFFDASTNKQGTGAWALDIINVDEAAPVGGVPEPASALLVTAGLLLAAIGRRRTSW